MPGKRKGVWNMKVSRAPPEGKENKGTGNRGMPEIPGYPFVVV